MLFAMRTLVLRTLPALLCLLLLFPLAARAQDPPATPADETAAESAPAADSAPALPLAEICIENGAATLTAGRIPVTELLRHLQVTTGKPVLYASIERYLAKALAPDSSIVVLEPIAPLTETIARAILAANHIQVREVILEDGSPVLHAVEYRDAELRTAPSAAQGRFPGARPEILDAAAEWRIDRDATGFVVVPVESARIQDLMRLVDRLVADKRLEIMPVGGDAGRHLALRGPAGSLEAARDLIRALDRSEMWPAPPPAAPAAEKSPVEDSGSAAKPSGDNGAGGEREERP